MPEAMIIDPLIATAAAGFLALLFARAAWHKASQFLVFTGVMSDYRILPDAVLVPAAALLIGLETVVAIGLVPEVSRPFAAVAGAGLLCIYAVAMIAPLMQGRTEISCGCGGPIDQLSWSLVVRNILLIGLLMVLTLLPSGRSMTWTDLVIVPVAVLAAWLLFEAIEHIVRTAGHIRFLRSSIHSEVH